MATLYSWSTEIGSRSKGGRRVGKKTCNTWSIYSNTDIERVATRGRPVSQKHILSQAFPGQTPPFLRDNGGGGESKKKKKIILTVSLPLQSDLLLFFFMLPAACTSRNPLLEII